MGIVGGPAPARAGAPRSQDPPPSPWETRAQVWTDSSERLKGLLGVGVAPFFRLEAGEASGDPFFVCRSRQFALVSAGASPVEERRNGRDGVASWSFYLEKCFGPEEALLIPQHPGHLPRAATVDGGATVCPPLMASVPESGAEMSCARTQWHSGSLGLIF